MGNFLKKEYQGQDMGQHKAWGVLSPLKPITVLVDGQ